MPGERAGIREGDMFVLDHYVSSNDAVRCAGVVMYQQLRALTVKKSPCPNPAEMFFPALRHTGY